VILTVDLGSSVTKVVVWGDDGPLAVGRSPLQCSYLPDNRAEQDPGSWWPSVVAACAAARTALGTRSERVLADVGAIGFAAARQTFVPVTADATPLGPALLWSDRRAHAEALSLAESFGDGGANAVRRRTGVVLDAGSVAAKVMWLERHEPERLDAARWLLAPRDLVAWHLTGEVSTDDTMASATGLYELSGGRVGGGGVGDGGRVGGGGDGGRVGGGGDGGRVGGGSDGLGPLVSGLVDGVANRLPASRPAATVLGGLLDGPAAELGLPVGTPVVIGAGDRACEVLGAGSSQSRPMVSWGTTANVSVPVGDLVDPTPEAMIVTRGALGGWLLEGGLSAAGSLVDWLARLGGLDTDSLMERARSSPPGSRGVIALPWLGGARAPWWRDTARGAFVGLAFDQGIGDLARAVVESVAWDVVRCLESAAKARPGGPTPVGLVLGGGGAKLSLWTEILAAVTGLSAYRRRSGEAASAGAAIVAARATGIEFDLERVDPIDAETAPDPSTAACYAAARPAVDAAAATVIELRR
jgi:xylulokinase